MAVLTSCTTSPMAQRSVRPPSCVVHDAALNVRITISSSCCCSSARSAALRPCSPLMPRSPFSPAGPRSPFGPGGPGIRAKRANLGQGTLRQRKASAHGLDQRILRSRNGWFVAHAIPLCCQQPGHDGGLVVVMPPGSGTLEFHDHAGTLCRARRHCRRAAALTVSCAVLLPAAPAAASACPAKRGSAPMLRPAAATTPCASPSICGRMP